jgi:undecaprenyl-diphosphatase
MIQTAIRNISHWDTEMCLVIFRWNGKIVLDRLMIFVSRFGDGYLYGAIGLLLILFDTNRFLSILYLALVAFPVELMIQKVIKYKLKRARPCHAIPEIENRIILPDQFSFPSGHTASAFVMASLISHAYPLLSVPVYFIAVLVGLSRIYNGVHYPSDVLAGMILGIGSYKFALLIGSLA